MTKTQTDPFPYGDGWMTSSARDLCRIMCGLGGLDAEELLTRISERVGNSGRDVNRATVEAVLDEWDD